MGKLIHLFNKNKQKTSMKGARFLFGTISKNNRLFNETFTFPIPYIE